MKLIKCLAFNLLLIVITLTSAQSQFSKISDACTQVLTPLISDKELNACIPLASLAPSGKNDTYDTLVKGADKLCAVDKCSDNLITTIQNNIEKGCTTDLTNQVPEVLAIDFLFTYYSPIRDSACLKNSTNGYCFIETIDKLKNYEKNITDVNSFDSALDSFNQLPTDVVCTTCNKAIANTFFNYQDANPDRTKRFATSVSSVKSTLGNKCGADFTSK
nr:14228_t:CDS:1 [Entrophospora candida]CAG8545142.1 12907_t:CDS:1 [Entrophospora candida]